MRSFFFVVLLAGVLLLGAGGVLLVRSFAPAPAPAEIVAGLEVGPEAAPDISNEAVLVLTNQGGRPARLLNIPGG